MLNNFYFQFIHAWSMIKCPMELVWLQGVPLQHPYRKAQWLYTISIWNGVFFQLHSFDLLKETPPIQYGISFTKGHFPSTIVAVYFTSLTHIWFIQFESIWSWPLFCCCLLQSFILVWGPAHFFCKGPKNKDLSLWGHIVYYKYCILLCYYHAKADNT